MKPFTSFLCRHYLLKLLSRKCDAIIPRSGEEGEKANCFSIKIDKNGEPFCLVTSINGEYLECLEWDGSKYSIEKSIKLDDVSPESFFITHYYGLSEVKYFGIVDLALGRLTRWPYVKINTVLALSRFDQYLFNKKKLVSKESVDLLKFLLSKQLDGKSSFSSLELMTDLYSIKWVLHPDGEVQHQKVEFYLDSLVDTGELKKINYEYVLTGNALRAIEEYEEQERKHTENVKMQRIMLWLTLVIAAFTAVQAGLVKLPPLLDLSTSLTRVASHDGV